MLKKIAEFKFIIAKTSLGLFFLFFSWLIVNLSKSSASFATELWQPIAIKITSFLARIFSFTRYSCVEIFLYLLIVLIVIAFIITIYKVFTQKDKLNRLLGFITGIFLLASFLFMLFECLYGFNYYASSKTEELDLQVKERAPSELSDLCKSLVLQANQLADSFTYDVGIPDSNDFAQMADDVTEIVSSYTHIEHTSPKKILLSVPMCYTGLTGVFAPFTGEANINTADLSISMPFTMAHELMHRSGVNPEDEANLFAFISLFECNNDCYRYSACYMGLLYSLPKLRKADSDAYKEILSLLSDRVKNDINAYHENWSKYEGKTSEIANKVNNSFLELHGEADGVQSYGNVVDWLLAYYEAHPQEFTE